MTFPKTQLAISRIGVRTEVCLLMPCLSPQAMGQEEPVLEGLPKCSRHPHQALGPRSASSFPRVFASAEGFLRVAQPKALPSDGAILSGWSLGGWAVDLEVTIQPADGSGWTRKHHWVLGNHWGGNGGAEILLGLEVGPWASSPLLRVLVPHLEKGLRAPEGLLPDPESEQEVWLLLAHPLPMSWGWVGAGLTWAFFAFCLDFMPQARSMWSHPSTLARVLTLDCRWGWGLDHGKNSLRIQCRQFA